MGCTIIGCGKQLPALDVPNEELTKLVDTSDEWISTRTGILSRRDSSSEGTCAIGRGSHTTLNLYALCAGLMRQTLVSM